MATPSTLNTWLDELSSSILNQKAHPKQNRRKLQDTFRRRAKRNTYARTNQFKVAKKLDGLEEKFQILTLDHLSDTLHQLRIDLNDHGHQWLPDVLDLLLQLSGDSARNDQILELYRIAPRPRTPPLLKWKDVLTDDPIDSNDILWKIPSFKDLDVSDYADEDVPTSAQSSPRYVRNQRAEYDALDAGQPKEMVGTKDLEDDGAVILDRFKSSTISPLRAVTELELMREVVVTLIGFPSTFLLDQAGSYSLNPNVLASTIPRDFLTSIAERVITIRCGIDRFQKWLAEESDCIYIEAMKNSAEKIMRYFIANLVHFAERLNGSKGSTFVSVVLMIDLVQEVSHEVLAIESFLITIESSDSIGCLESLYRYTSDSQTFGDQRTYSTMISLLVPALKAYLHPLWRWIEAGTIDQNERFFVKFRAETTDLNHLWKDQFAVDLDGIWRPPNFLADALESIFICGKTAFFLKSLHSQEQWPCPDLTKSSFDWKLNGVEEDCLMPFDITFRGLFTDHLSRLLLQHTINLKMRFTGDCSLTQTLFAISQIYLAQGIPILTDIERKAFDKIDRCVDSWNDRFLIIEMLEEEFLKHHAESISETITIRSVYTSSRTMQSRRKSVKIMAALAFDYHLSWPISNIIDSASMVSYQRISLLLTQIRRASYSLQNTGYIRASTIPLGEDATSVDQTFAQVLVFELLAFLNTIYQYLTVTVIVPATKLMHHQMVDAHTIDTMIGVHQEYINRIEFSCLASPKLNVVREVLINLLDMCIRFSDLVSSWIPNVPDDVDHENGSFRSARSYHRTAHGALRGSGSDDDDDFDGGGIEEGYSSFIILENDTTIIKELHKLRDRFSQQLKLFVAGIRGVGRGSQNMEDLDGLANQIAANVLK